MYYKVVYNMVVFFLQNDFGFVKWVLMFEWLQELSVVYWQLGCSYSFGFFLLFFLDVKDWDLGCEQGFSCEFYFI